MEEGCALHPPRVTEKEVAMTSEQLAKLLKTTPQNINLLCRNGILTKGKDDDGNADFDIVKNVGAYVEYLRSKAGDDSQQRKNKATAHMAEMEAAREERTLCLRADYRNNMADAIAQGTARISRLRSLSSRQKEEVFAVLRAVKLADLDEGDSDEDKEGE